MKRVRILTGKHAGASVDLASGNHSTGPDHDCDISITDWTFAPLQLAVTGSGDVTACWSDNNSAGHSADRQHAFKDFEPRAFGDIVLCVGAVDRDWPTDLQLLDAAFQATPQRMARWAGTRLRARASSVLAGFSVLALCVMGSTLMLGSSQADKPRETLPAATARVRQVIDKLDARGLKLQTERGGLLITGMVSNPAQAQALNAAVEGLASSVLITRRVSVASDVAETIRNTVGVPGAEVKYMGEGVFAFTAESRETKAVRQAIDRVSADLGDVVRRIDVTLEQSDQKPADIPILSSMKDDEISVVQTRDGIKHLVVTEPDRTVSVSKALSIRPPGVTTTDRHSQGATP
jgi:type III secretion protein D